MAKIHPIQNAFTAGILTPRFLARTDIDGYRSGVEDMLNMIPYKHGPAAGRGGTETMAELSGDIARVFGMQLSPDTNIGEVFAIFRSCNCQVKAFRLH